MKVIESKMINAIANKKNKKLENTEVDVDRFGNVYVYLFGNNIANINQNGTWSFSNCGYNTKTTRERLNVILDYLNPGLRIVQRDWKWYLYRNNEKIKQLDGYFYLNQNIEAKPNYIC